MSAIKYQMIPVFFFADINNHKIVLRPPPQTTNGATLETVKLFYVSAIGCDPVYF